MIMFFKKHKLSRQEFQKIFQEGKSYKNASFLLKILENKNEKGKIGVSVSSSIAKGAVIRNYYKRVVRNIIKELLPRGVVRSDFILILNNKEKSFEELKKDAKELLQMAKVL